MRANRLYREARPILSVQENERFTGDQRSLVNAYRNSHLLLASCSVYDKPTSVSIRSTFKLLGNQVTDQQGSFLICNPYLF